MSGVFELCAVGTFSISAASTLSLSGYAHIKMCLEGLVKKKPKHQQKNHHLDAPHQKELLDGPLKKEGVPVKLDNTSIGKRGVEFNGEILFISSSSSGKLAPAMALGACDIVVKDSKVAIQPPAIQKTELTFANAAEAQQWAKEFNEAKLVGPPQERIQELILHSMRVEKHVSDLRARSEKVAQLEEHANKLKSKLKMQKAGLADEPSSARAETSSVLSAWFRAGTTSRPDDKEKARLNLELQKSREEFEKAQRLNKSLRGSIVENARTNHEVALTWRRFVNGKIAQYKDQMERQSSSGRDLTAPDEVLDCDPQPEPKLAAQQKPPFANVNQSAQQAKQSPFSRDFDQRFKDVENQLALSQRSYQEEKVMDNALAEKQVYTTQLAFNSTDRPKFEPLLSTRTLEERIRSHQSQVYQDCDALQQAFKARMV